MRDFVFPKAWRCLLVTLCVALVVAMSLVGCSGSSEAQGPEADAEKSAEQERKTDSEATDEADAEKTAQQASEAKTDETDDEANDASSDIAWNSYDEVRSNAVQALESRMAAERKTLYVYKDYGLTVNHFTQKAKMWGNNEYLVKDMNEDWQENPYAGDSCIRCEQTTQQGDWGGWLFLNGYLSRGDAKPELNDGSVGGQGLNLTGAKEMRFWARGENGGEKVEFFCAGFGYDGETNLPMVDYHDSARKASLGTVTLTNEWQEYVISLGGKDMSYIVCGFGYVLSGETGGDASHVFYLDEIRFEGDISALRTAPVMMRSYDTDDDALKNAAYSSDNALVALALISEGKDYEAKQILDAFVYAARNDRSALEGTSESKRPMRNAYAAGDISAFPGWASGVRLSGFMMNGVWTEDSYQTGCDLGSISWVAVALLQYYKRNGSEEYITTACDLMDWVIESCSYGEGDGFTDGENGNQERLMYKTTSHNIAACAAFRELYALTGEERYHEAATRAEKFAESMYDELGLFMTGTKDDGSPNADVVTLDAQVCGALVLDDDSGSFEGALNSVLSMRTDEGGYPYCQQNANGGWWTEGTAYTALMWRDRKNEKAYNDAMDVLMKEQLDDGLFPAANVDNLYTGVWLFAGTPDEKPWEYSRDAHIAPTAWFVMAANGFNPYEFPE